MRDFLIDALRECLVARLGFFAAERLTHSGHVPVA
jgi:hypothetical protein